MRPRPEQRHEMVEKPHLRDPFFELRSVKQQRPPSVATEFMVTDWEVEEDDDDNSHSEFELEDGEISPRGSFNSVSASQGRPLRSNAHTQVVEPTQLHDLIVL